METKFCPSCGAEAPEAATRCKACFADFPAAHKRSRATGPLLLLAAVTGAALLLAGAVYYRASRPVDQRVHIDENTHMIHWVTQYQSGDPKTDRISFDEVSRLEYRNTGTGRSEIWAITSSGEEKMLAMDLNHSLEGQAKQYAEIMGKPLEKIGFLASEPETP